MSAAIVAGVVGAAGAVAAAGMSASASKKAAKTGQEGAREASAIDWLRTQQAMEQANQRLAEDQAQNLAATTQSRNDLQPYANVGKGGLNALSIAMGLGNPQAKQMGVQAKQKATQEYQKLIQGEIARRSQALQTLRKSPAFATMTPAQRAAAQAQIAKESASKFGALNANKAKYIESAYQKSQQLPSDAGELVRKFNANDYRMDPTTGGNAPPDLTKNFEMSDLAIDPGYQFRVNEGNKAINNSAAAHYGLLSGATLKAIDKYSSDQGSQEYGNAFNRFNINRENAANVYGNAFNRWTGQNQNKFNRLSGITNMGQEAATNQAGFTQAGANRSSAALTNNANMVGGYLTNAGQRQGDYITQGANANMAGQVGSANAWNQGFGNAGNSLMQGAYMYGQQNKKPEDSNYNKYGIRTGGNWSF